MKQLISKQREIRARQSRQSGQKRRHDAEGAASGVLVFQCGTAAMECMRQYISEVLDFMADMHTLTKLKVRALASARRGSATPRGVVSGVSRPDGDRLSPGQAAVALPNEPMAGGLKN